jgi:hypothetical protein
MNLAFRTENATGSSKNTKPILSPPVSPIEAAAILRISAISGEFRQ